ncbi:hypothetical protein GCM10009766_24130 [Microcella frigidaquae]
MRVWHEHLILHSSHALDVLTQQECVPWTYAGFALKQPDCLNFVTIQDGTNGHFDRVRGDRVASRELEFPVDVPR